MPQTVPVACARHRSRHRHRRGEREPRVPAIACSPRRQARRPRPVLFCPSATQKSNRRPHRLLRPPLPPSRMRDPSPRASVLAHRRGSGSRMQRRQPGRNEITTPAAHPALPGGRTSRCTRRQLLPTPPTRPPLRRRRRVHRAAARPSTEKSGARVGRTPGKAASRRQASARAHCRSGRRACGANGGESGTTGWEGSGARRMRAP